MKRVTIPLIVALLLLAISALAFDRVQAATVQQQATATTRATSTPRATRTPASRATVTPRATATETADESEATEVTEVITGSVIPLTIDPDTEINAQRTLTVVGFGEVSAPPDVASITVGVDTTSEDIQEALDENTEKIAAIRAVIEELDIPARNVQTEGFSIFVERREPEPRLSIPRESDEEGVTVETQQQDELQVVYHVSQRLRVRIEDLDENLPLIGDLITQSVEAGANNVFGPNFQLANTDALEQRARRAAVQDAYARAQDWATLSGVELVGVASVREGSAGGPEPLFERAVAEAAGDDFAVDRGTLNYSEQVTVTFYIK